MFNLALLGVIRLHPHSTSPPRTIIHITDQAQHTPSSEFGIHGRPLSYPQEGEFDSHPGLPILIADQCPSRWHHPPRTPKTPLTKIPSPKSPSPTLAGPGPCLALDRLPRRSASPTPSHSSYQIETLDERGRAPVVQTSSHTTCS
jgi:hypothetical protein